MADRQISDLELATTINNSDLFVLEQSSTAKKITGSTFKSLMKGEKGDTGYASTAIDDSVTDTTHTWTSSKISGSISNRNLLINPFFTVNQRGVTSYSNEYGVDMWKSASASNTVTVLSNGIQIDFSIASDTVYQVLEIDKSTLEGKTLTLSAMLTDGNIYSTTFTVTTGDAYFNTRLGSSNVEMHFRSISSSWGIYPRIRFLSTAANATVSIKAVKLEIGSVSTLAMDVAPNYTEELLKCERYFLRAKSFWNPMCYGRYIGSNSKIIWVMPIAVPFRTTPSISCPVGARAVGNGSTITITSPTFANSDTVVRTNFVQFQCACDSVPASSVLYILELTSNSYIDFSAEL